MADSDLARCLHDVEIAVKDNKIYVDSYICTRIFAELKYPDEVVKTTTKGNLLKQSTFYKETRDEVCRRAGKAVSAPYSQRGLVRFQTGYMGGYTRSWKETPPTSMT